MTCTLALNVSLPLNHIVHTYNTYHIVCWFLGGKKHMGKQLYPLGSFTGK